MKNRKLGYPYTYGDDLSDKQARENVKNVFRSVKKHRKALFQGLVFGASVAPSAAFADEIKKGAAKPISKSTKALIRRSSNAVACGLVLKLCTKSGGDKIVEKAAEQVVDKGTKLVVSNPSTAAAFACGVAVAWCVKYAIYDK